MSRVLLFVGLWLGATVLVGLALGLLFRHAGLAADDPAAAQVPTPVSTPLPQPRPAPDAAPTLAAAHA